MYVEKRLGRVFAVFVGFFALTLDTTLHAAPQNGRVVEGAGSIERSGNTHRHPTAQRLLSHALG